MDPFGNGSCISEDDVEDNIYAKKFNATYSRQVNITFSNMRRNHKCLPKKLNSYQENVVLNFRGNKCSFWKIPIEALEEFPTVIIQSSNSATTQETPKIVTSAHRNENTLLNNFGTINVGCYPYRRPDFALNWYVFPQLFLVLDFIK